MNDRLSAFCSGIGFAGLVVAYGVFSGNGWVSAVLVAWSVILVPVGIIDAVCDQWGKRHR